LSGYLTKDFQSIKQKTLLAFCIAAGGEIENRLTIANEKKKYDDEIIEKFFRKSPAQTKAGNELQLMLRCPAKLLQNRFYGLALF